MFYFFMTIMILNEFHVDTTSLLAGASIIGLAIGVGAQSLVKDFVAGFFIILEGQYSIGDYVTVKGFSGIVTNVNLRTTRICSADKVFHTIPNGMIDIVSNYTRGMYVATIRVAVSQTADPDVVLPILQDALDAVSVRSDVRDEGASVGGLAQMDGSSFIYEVSIPALRSDAYGVCTAYRYEVAKRLNAAKVPLARIVIENADPQDGLQLGQEKQEG
jgi:small conductance mechanosensitive channel